MKKYQDLGELLKDYRQYHGVSQSELASEVDVDIRTVIRWEKNETLINSEKEDRLVKTTFIPYQVIRNLNTTTQIPTFYDFDLRKYSLSYISTELPDAAWITSRIEVTTDRLRPISSKSDITPILRYNHLQKNPLKNKSSDLIWEASQRLPELNMILFDQSGYYSGHCVYFPLSLETYQKIRARDIKEYQLGPQDLINYKNDDSPVLYCHSITADCNEHFFYIIGAVLKFYKNNPIKNYLYALLTSRYDSHNMSDQLGVKTVWEDFETQKKYNLRDAPRLVEGTFDAFLKTN